ncbi:gas vesicle protein GvpA [Haladaptatus caseinilyticus]|uniref:gas vesicle protein GvpA n=1 Tax=Haladaptatus caseinilyticus TaxID=2993314 RepID=UPI00224A49FE|nr:gas vesicle structural protein GvpA [Haladaptatus caseinilyticus]
MTQQTPQSSSLAAVLDRILDKGVVTDVWARIAVVGLELITIEARIVVVSVDTFLHYCAEIGAIEAGTVPDDSQRAVSVPA